MVTLTEVAVTTFVPCRVELKHSAVEVGVGRREPICGLLLLLLVVIVIIVVFSVVVVGVALTESALTERSHWSIAISDASSRYPAAQHCRQEGQQHGTARGLEFTTHRHVSAQAHLQRAFDAAH